MKKARDSSRLSMLCWVGKRRRGRRRRRETIGGSIDILRGGPWKRGRTDRSMDKESRDGKPLRTNLSMIETMTSQL